MPGFLKKMLLLTGALMFALLLGEVFLRLVGYSPAVMSPLSSFHQADEELGWIGIPNRSARFQTLNFDVPVELGADGFRKSQPVEKFESGTPEIWVMGDSTAWGWGVSNEDLMTNQLQKLYGEEARVVNYGINAYGTLQEGLLLRRLLENSETLPQQLLLMVCSNDFVDNLTPQGGARPYLEKDGGGYIIRNQPVEYRIGGFSSTLSRKSYAFSFLSHWGAILKQLRKRKGMQETFGESWSNVSAIPQGVTPDRLPEDQTDAMAFAMKKIATLCDENDIELTVITFPVATTLYEIHETDLAIADICNALGVRHLTLGDEMTVDREKYYVGNGDFHWNEAGNLLGAELLYRKLKEPAKSESSLENSGAPESATEE